MFIGYTADVLFEQEKDGLFEGLTGNYLRVFVSSKEKLEGKIKRVKIKKRENGKLIASLLEVQCETTD